MAISALIAGAPGMEIVAPCVCSDCTRWVLALTAPTASMGLGKAVKAIGGGSPLLRRSQEWERQPKDGHKNENATIQHSHEPRPCGGWKGGCLVVWFFDPVASASMRLQQLGQLFLNGRGALGSRHHLGNSILVFIPTAVQYE